MDTNLQMKNMHLATANVTMEEQETIYYDPKTKQDYIKNTF